MHWAGVVEADDGRRVHEGVVAAKFEMADLGNAVEPDEIERCFRREIERGFLADLDRQATAELAGVAYKGSINF
jgi:hypothetical protein